MIDLAPVGPVRSPRYWVLALRGWLLGVQEAQSIVVYQLVVFALHPSWLAARMVLLGWVINQIAVSIVITLRLVRSRRELISSGLDRMRRCTFARHSIRTFLDPSVHALIEHSFFRRLQGRAKMLRGELQDTIHIYEVNGPAVMEQLSCYLAPSMVDSHIFISDPPAETRGLRRFFVLHELGHSQLAMFTHMATFRLWMWPYLCFALWVALTGTWTATTAWVGAAYLCVLLLWWEQWDRRFADQRLLGEMVADAFALAYLPPADLARLAENRRLSALLDRELDEFQNTTRLARLRENIQLAQQGRTKEVVERSMATFPIPDLRMLAGGIGMVVVIAVLTAAPPTVQMANLLLRVAAALAVWWTYLTLRVVYLEMRIRARVGIPLIGSRRARLRAEARARGGS